MIGSDYVPPDADARARALDVSKSILVQAPAGSGKTELLTDRFLALLAEVEEPEQVLAITFTRAATAEMRRRVLEKLEGASRTPDQSSSAHKALLHSQQRQWQLMEQPHRLNIQTIDSLCLSIAHRTPLLSRLGGTLKPTENAKPLYELAAERTLQRLGGANGGLNAALSAVLELRDNNLADCERLVAEMLEQRDQWGHLFLLSGDVDWGAVRARLELPFQREIQRVLGRIHTLVSHDPDVAMELVELARHACGGEELAVDIALLAELDELPPASINAMERWQCFANFLLTKEKTLRKQVTKAEGFPSGAKNPHYKRMKDRMQSLLTRLTSVPGMGDALCAVREMPPPKYDDAQWAVLLHLFSVLRHAVAELKVAFAEQNVVDFVEIAMAAEMVLRAPSERPDDPSGNSGDLALALSEDLRHLLVDEFQDTSRRQHGLLTSLLRGWSACDGRTCFLVGDPMQSIYAFRQAEVELFNHVGRHGLECEGGTVEFETLNLSTNWRSHSGLVGPLNAMFPAIFGQAGAGEIAFVAAQAKSEGKDAVHVHPLFVDPAAGPNGPTGPTAVRLQEAADAVAIIRSYGPQFAEARRSGGEFTIGVLVRAKDHARRIAEALRAENVPYRAVELEELGKRQEVLDLVALARALAHPMDRVAWLAVLRAPWCGLEMRDLHAIASFDMRKTEYMAVAEAVEQNKILLSREGQQRAQFVLDILLAAIEDRRSPVVSFASRVERTWRALGGPLCVDATGYENVQAFFRMLDTLTPDSTVVLGGELGARLEKLFAQPDPEASERVGVQIMTIHKAKGLGFDVVVVPGLERRAGKNEQPLICWLQRLPRAADGEGDEAGAAELEMLVAPIGNKGVTANGLYKWVQLQKSRREEDERKRLLYVVCTRAKQALHLFGTATVQKDRSLSPGRGGSLLATAWPAVEADFVSAFARATNYAVETPGNVAEFPANRWMEHDSVMDLAAAGTDSGQPTMLRRLPLEFLAAPGPAPTVPLENQRNYGDTLFQRPEASRSARAFGTAVHALFERAGRSLAAGTPLASLTAAVPDWRAQASSILRNNGVASNSLQPLANRAIDALQSALADPLGQWLLGPRSQAHIESSWTGWLDGELHTLRVDRVFRAGAGPLSDGEDCLWIVDYKTATHGTADPGMAAQGMAGLNAFLEEERIKYQGQLHSYGRMLRLALSEEMPLRLALYYPLLGKLIYSEA